MVINSDYYMIGDIDGDGGVGANDSNMMKRIIANKISPVDAADLDNDKNITPFDSSCLKKLITGTWTPAE